MTFLQIQFHTLNIDRYPEHTRTEILRKYFQLFTSENNDYRFEDHEMSWQRASSRGDTKMDGHNLSCQSLFTFIE